MKFGLGFAQSLCMETTLKNTRKINFTAENGDLISALELSMTRSTFGHQYALDALRKEGELGSHAEILRKQLEDYKSSYFSAREQLYSLDKQRLQKIEQDLFFQKQVLFSFSQEMH